MANPMAPLTTQTKARIAKASADQWMNLEEVWCAKMAKRDQAMAMEAGRSPSGVENA